MFVPRILSSKISRLATQFPVVTLTGPRQSGKSTLLRAQFPDYKYVTLENPDMREFAALDPNGFIKSFPERVIIDEAQRVPKLFSYLQGHIDEVNKPGMYMLAGSQNFHLMDAIDQSLAGRVAVLTLLPFSRLELHEVDLLPNDVNQQIFTGFYPRIYDRDISPADYYASYLSTYVERDVRTLRNIGDLNRFTRMLRLCAGRIGQLLNLSSLANECGVSVPTVDSWLSLLEASYIVYRLEPNYNNYNKRVVKTPKLYFYDTGLACHLLGISSVEQVDSHYLRGALFENLVINQFLKAGFNSGVRPDLTFWRDSSGLEVDLLKTDGMAMSAYEIKSSSTFHAEYFKGLSKWAELSATPVERLSVIYDGEHSLATSQGNVYALNEFFG